MFRITAILAVLIAGLSPAMAAKLHPRCNIDWPCAPMSIFSTSKVVKKIDTTRAERREARRIARGQRLEERSPIVSARGDVSIRSYINGATILPHPAGCPRRAFCGCGAAVEVFGRPVRSLWLAANWLAFPRTSPAPGMVAARRGHVFVIKEVLGGGKVLAYDANSGGRRTRLHVRSLAGFAVVNPHG